MQQEEEIALLLMFQKSKEQERKEEVKRDASRKELELADAHGKRLTTTRFNQAKNTLEQIKRTIASFYGPVSVQLAQTSSRVVVVFLDGWFSSTFGLRKSKTLHEAFSGFTTRSLDVF